jgi:hypothetical protein
MCFDVSIESIKATNKCGHNFECLSGDFSNCLCTINSQLIKSGIYIDDEKKMNSGCPYFFNFGNSSLCNCPVRIEIFKKYKI